MAMEREAVQKAQKAQLNNIPQVVLQPVSVPSVSWFTVYFCTRVPHSQLTTFKHMSLSKNKTMATNEKRKQIL